MEVIDYDGGSRFPHEVVDAYSINIPSATTVGLGPVLSNTPGLYGLGFISLTAKVLCAQLYHGDKCQYVNVCERDSILCSGHGVCMPEMNSSSCVCNSGFLGDSCEVIDYCLGLTCNMKGVCVNRPSSYWCVCDPGFTGRDCETDINECEGQNCSGNGRCADLVNMFVCVCHQGFTGTLCDSIDDCVGVNCSGNGQCIDEENKFTCLCESGFTGDLCNMRKSL